MTRFLKSLPLLFIFLSFNVFAAKFVKLDNKLDGYQEKLKDYVIETKIIDTGLNHPWSIIWTDNRTLLMTEKRGKLFKYGFDDEGGFEKTEITGLPEFFTYGQGGLLDIKTHPNYLINGWIYITYSAVNPKNNLQSTLTLARFRLINDAISNFEVLFQARPYIQSTRHYGSRISFDRENRVYFSSGDRGYRDNAQKTKNHIGKIIRLNADGTVPNENPFLVKTEGEQASEINKENEAKFIYSFGHRNPQGLVFYKGKLYVHEHGPKGGDEFNVVEAGKNYGWPTISYGKEYLTGLPVGESFKAGMEQPILYWDPSIAPSGLTVYQGNAFQKWEGQFFLGSLVFGQIIRLQLNSENQVVDKENILDGRFGRIRDITVREDGSLYFITDQSNGFLVQIKPVK